MAYNIFIDMKYTKEYLELLVNSSKCMWDVVEKAEMSKQQGNYFYLSKLINKYKISINHFENQKKDQNRVNKPLKEYLVKNKYLTLNGNRLKSKLYKAGLKTPFCEICGQGEEWRGKRMSLILDRGSVAVSSGNRITKVQITTKSLIV